jgi:hypothetical protein
MTGSIKHILGGAIALVFAASVAVTPVGAAPVLTFEGLGDLETVGNFYSGLGINFAPSAQALVDADAGGSGNIGGEPSPSTVVFFPFANAIEMNVTGGFDTGISFYYSAPFEPGFVRVWDGFDASGNLLASIDLPLTADGGAMDPTGRYSPLLPFGLAFDGIALSVEFGGVANMIVYDDIALGEVFPSQRVPLPGSLLLLAAGALGAGLVRRRVREHE